MKAILVAFLLACMSLLASNAHAEGSTTSWGNKGYSPSAATSYLSRVESKNNSYLRKNRNNNSYGRTVRPKLDSYTRQQENLASGYNNSLRNAANGSTHIERQLRNVGHNANVEARNALLSRFK